MTNQRWFDDTLYKRQFVLGSFSRAITAKTDRATEKDVDGKEKRWQIEWEQIQMIIAGRVIVDPNLNVI